MNTQTGLPLNYILNTPPSGAHWHYYHTSYLKMWVFPILPNSKIDRFFSILMLFISFQNGSLARIPKVNISKGILTAAVCGTNTKTSASERVGCRFLKYKQDLLSHQKWNALEFEQLTVNNQIKYKRINSTFIFFLLFFVC